MRRGTETSLGYLGCGLTAAILFMLSKGIKTDPSDIATLVEKCMYLLPYFFMSITAPMIIMGMVSVFIKPALEMRCQYIVLTVSLITVLTGLFLSGDAAPVYGCMAVILGHFASSALFIPISAKNYERIRKKL